MVYVIDKGGSPLMPTERHGKVRRLLREGKAHVVKLEPFTIQLDYESTSFTQTVSLGVDAGSTHIGVSATTQDKELFSAQVELRTDVVKKLSDRLSLRRTRRFRKTRYRPARFDNRRRSDGWLAPSIKNKVEAHLKVIRMVHLILPVTKTTIEVAQFDTQLIKNPDISGTDYQQGEQVGFWNVREYVLTRDGHTCQHCKGKSKDKILNVHHIESRKTGGDAPSNLITLCKTCHKAYHRGEIKLKVKRSTSLRDAAAMNIMRWTVYEQAKAEFPNVYLTYGYITKHKRIENRIQKTHCTDAYCIANNLNARRSGQYYKLRLLPRHSRSLHVNKPQSGGKRRSAVASHWIGKSHLQRFDTVRWNGIKCFIFGSTLGRPVLRDIDGILITKSPSINVKCVEYIHRKHQGQLIQLFTCESSIEL